MNTLSETQECFLVLPTDLMKLCSKLKDFKVVNTYNVAAFVLVDNKLSQTALCLSLALTHSMDLLRIETLPKSVFVWILIIPTKDHQKRYLISSCFTRQCGFGIRFLLPFSLIRQRSSTFYKGKVEEQVRPEQWQCPKGLTWVTYFKSYIQLGQYTSSVSLRLWYCQYCQVMPQDMPKCAINLLWSSFLF